MLPLNPPAPLPVTGSHNGKPPNPQLSPHKKTNSEPFSLKDQESPNPGLLSLEDLICFWPPVPEKQGTDSSSPRCVCLLRPCPSVWLALLSPDSTPWLYLPRIYFIFASLPHLLSPFLQTCLISTLSLPPLPPLDPILRLLLPAFPLIYLCLCLPTLGSVATVPALC